MNIEQTLLKVAAFEGVSGDEKIASKSLLKLIEELDITDYRTKTDNFGNTMLYLGEQQADRKTLLLEAHLDRIGFTVTYIDDNGFVKVGEIGRGDKRILPCQSVTIYGKEIVKGVVCSLPPHVKSSDAPKLEDIYIDTGYSKKVLEGMISLGDTLLIDSKPTSLLDGRVTSAALDNRAGVVAVLHALELLSEKQTKYNIVALFAAQEEVGTRGARVGTFGISPDEAIVVDVSFAKSPDTPANRAFQLGGGAMLGYSPVLNKEMGKRLLSLAKASDIPVLHEVMGGTTGTDADVISDSRNGVKTALLSIPLRYMHSPVEVVDVKDVEAVAKLMALYGEAV